MTRDETEARQLLDKVLSRLRLMSYEELKQVYSGEGKHWTEVGTSGTVYQFEAQSFLDDRKLETLRVSIGIDGGPISEFRPLSDGFILEKS